ncbi:sodium:proton exchanger [Streptomyces sp. NPDC026673]|uniref:sodium:proton exchanger n=1 Tax=Streptomyces sp. NPDC026673 TaxID=3155724 RepID=UPI0033D47E6D
MTEDQVLVGVGLIVVIAVGCQVLASRLRIPALIVLLPAGFAAGALTDDYDAGLGLDLARFRAHTRRVTVHLIWLGVLLTWASVALLAPPLLDMGRRTGVLLGAILVVSGPTVVAPLLAFVRPTERVRRILVWEGTLIDPIGALLGALTFHAVSTQAHRGFAAQSAQFLLSTGVGVAGAAAGTAILVPALRRLRSGEVLDSLVQFAVVVGVAAVCDIVRDDAGLIAAVLMGLAVANAPGAAAPSRRPFFEPLVALVIGLLFVSISAGVTPHSLRGLLLPALGLVAVLVLVVRPLVAALASWGTGLTAGERGLIGWMAPRGIVAASTAATFAAELSGHGLKGADRILPVTFLVIVATVTLYGLTAAPVARRLGALAPARSRPLLVGGAPWVVDLGRALRSAGLEVVMWAGSEEERERIRAAGLEVAPGELFAAATGAGAELAGLTAILLLTGEDDFNALASTNLQGSLEGPVYRLAPPSDSHGVVAPFTGGEVLFAPELTRPEVQRRYDRGERIVTRGVDGPLPEPGQLLFLVRPDGRLHPATRSAAPLRPRPGDAAVLLTR